jgi:hypothetical protein
VAEGAPLRVASAASAADPDLARDLLVAVREYLAMFGDPETLDPETEEIPRLRRLTDLADALASELGEL